MKINFSEDAVIAVSEKAMSNGTSPLNECNSLFKDFQFGLKLIHKNTGKDDFLIPAEAINDPDSYLSSMVVSSYREVEKEN